jgi:hypothetical protein
MKPILVCFCLLVASFMPAVSFAQDNQDNSDQIAKVEKKVTKHLHSYFMTKGVVGIPSSAVPEKVDVDIDTTKAVQGWTRRYETTGTATITTAPLYSPNYACHFDVISEIDDEGVVRIVDTRSERINNN